MEVLARPKFGLGQQVWHEGCEYRVNCQHVFANGTVSYDLVRDDGNTWLYVHESDLSADPPDPYQGWTLEECRQEVHRRGYRLAVGDTAVVGASWKAWTHDVTGPVVDAATAEEAARALLRKMDAAKEAKG